MAHGSQLHFLRLLCENFEDHTDGRVLEIGSLDLNGSIRKFFPNADYTGVDIDEGPGVDEVCAGQDYAAPDDSFDVVVCCNVMEHNPYWAETFRNMIRLCRPGGLVVMTCGGTGFPEHGTARTDPSSSPFTVEQGWDYYHNLTEKQCRSAVDLTALGLHRFWVNWRNYDLLFAGIKGGAAPPTWEHAARQIDAWVVEENAPPSRRFRAAMAHLFGERWFTTLVALKAQIRRVLSIPKSQ